MSVLSDILSGYTTKLTNAGFTAYLPNREPKDPDGSFHRKFLLDEDSGATAEGALQMGGTGIELITPILLTVHWEPADAESTIKATVADDQLVILAAMLKDSNKPTGCRLISLSSITREEKKRPITKHFRFDARYTETGTFT